MAETLTVRVAERETRAPCGGPDLTSDGAPLPPFSAGAHIDLISGGDRPPVFTVRQPHHPQQYRLGILGSDIARRIAGGASAPGRRRR
jgi:vanillate O-demethylase ferredoxin subunit